jgi:uncharacterized membrane protein
MVHPTGAGVRPTTPKYSDTTVSVILAIDRGVYQASNHWLMWVGAIMFMTIGFAILAPILVAAGHPNLARPIYGYFSFFCHQRADRSFHLSGEKMACCERCAAVYGTLAVGSILFFILRDHIKPPRLRYIGYFALPLALDGLSQLAGFRESTTELRVITGAIFGLSLSWLIYPYLEKGFAEMREKLEIRFNRLAAEGRAEPLRKT